MHYDMPDPYAAVDARFERERDRAAQFEDACAVKVAGLMDDGDEIAEQVAQWVDDGDVALEVEIASVLTGHPDDFAMLAERFFLRLRDRVQAAFEDRAADAVQADWERAKADAEEERAEFIAYRQEFGL